MWSQFDALPLDSQERIEILFLVDNKQIMLGQKRNIMVDMAQGEYIVFVDDDDRISDDYLASLLEATESYADVITFLVEVSLNGDPSKICRYSKDYRRDLNTPDEYQRLPNHICCVKRELAQKVSFPSIAHGEDSAYSKLLKPNLHTEHAIDRVLYYYDYSDETSETQPRRRGVIRVRPNQKPIVDVVILSNSLSMRIHKMTQRTIDSCLTGANSLPVNVIVLEQQNVTYKRATTVTAPGPFNYNRFANRGAMLGAAEWIMVANNDLIFHDGWLHNLLAAGHPVVSPKCPRDPRQYEFTENITGYVTARHLSGWCFMIKRRLWQRIGGFDDCVDFWCSDDVVIEQLKQIGIEPMLVVDSIVEHLQSVTLRQQINNDDLTWKQIDIFSRKYGSHRLSSDPRFLAWKQNQDA